MKFNDPKIRCDDWEIRFLTEEQEKDIFNLISKPLVEALNELWRDKEKSVSILYKMSLSQDLTKDEYNIIFDLFWQDMEFMKVFKRKAWLNELTSPVLVEIAIIIASYRFDQEVNKTKKKVDDIL